MTVRQLNTYDYVKHLLKHKILGLDFRDIGNLTNSIDFVNDMFREKYLSGLKSFVAFGLFDDEDGHLLAAATCYISSENCEWYLTTLYGHQDEGIILLDEVSKIMEGQGVNKFYFISSGESSYKLDKYLTVKELTVDALTKCPLLNIWQILFQRMMCTSTVDVQLAVLLPQFR